MAHLQALHNGIIFQFEEEIRGYGKNQSFDETTKSGLYLGRSYDSTAKQARWGVVTSAGKEVLDKGIVPGTRVLIEALKWTKGFQIDGQKYWKTDEDCVMLVDDA